MDVTTRVKNPGQTEYNAELHRAALERQGRVLRYSEARLSIAEMAQLLRVSQGRVKQLLKAARRARDRGELTTP